MKKIRQINVPTFFFYLLTILMLLVSAISFVSALKWISRPFAGFLIYEHPYVGSMGNAEWLGIKKGLRMMDRIVAADGLPVFNKDDINRLLESRPAGSLIEYTIQSKGKLSKVTVPIDIFGPKDFFLVFFIPFIVGFTLFILGIIAFVLKPETAASRVFYALCFCLGTYMVTGFETMSSYYLVRFHHLIYPLFPLLFVHLALIFPERNKILNHFPKLEYLIYLPALYLLPAYQIYFSTFEKNLSTGLYPWVHEYYQIGVVNRYNALICALIMLFLLFHSMFRAQNSAARQRARMVLFGASIAFFPAGIIMITVSMLKFNFPWNYLPFFVVFFPAAIAFSIVKHNMFDADEIIKRTVGYFVVSAVVIGAYVLVSLGLNIAMEHYQITGSKAFPILFTLVIILIFNPLRDRIQAIVDRIFFRKEYDSGKIIDKISDAVSSLLDLEQILKRTTGIFTNDMFINTSSIMLLDAAQSEYRVYLADGDVPMKTNNIVLKAEDNLIQILEKRKKELTKNDLIERSEFRGVRKVCAEKFDILKSSLIVPLIYRNKMIGLLNLGEKKSGKFYNREDIDLFRTIANQGAVAIENVRLFQENLEKQRMEEELSIARELQKSMLPSTCPEIKGFEIAAYSTQAREVGGDFYDFIKMDEEKLGIVIGDVTGKSVSGALVMSAARSVLRLLTEEGLSVGEIMARGNRRTKKDGKTGMFVALLYVVLDARKKNLGLCSAGQTQPVYVSADTGEAVLIQTEGDTFPLGILDEVEYMETRLDMIAGDKIILYTDGIVEAMNEQEEMYGFDRLLETTGGTELMNAEELLEKIVSSVDTFSGSAAQHDDLTIIVLGVKRDK